jgi:hypothetical protein
MKNTKFSLHVITVCAILCVLPFLFLAGCAISTDDTEIIVKSIGSVTGIASDAETGDPLWGAFVTLGD